MGGTHEENAVGSQTPRASNLLEPAPVAPETLPTDGPGHTTRVRPIPRNRARDGRGASTAPCGVTLSRRRGSLATASTRPTAVPRWSRAAPLVPGRPGPRYAAPGRRSGTSGPKCAEP